ncbi:MAG: hypothetical protein AB2728_09305 [Candidatus Thiodiazotropha sp.]|nr:hypothetical protein [Candidatus Thiodiazotropha sp. (ex Lucina pensylvanica)]MBT3061697.1 hypothetical protein [Candidatus Thiodiazotropha sp. (ex Lucina pensylvanica)]PUB72834.1 MAG: hypothetical protein DBP03_15015 [gamma proteobacterium symbiont of Ctena orbiculata]PUB76211.1 MAG: hypothetical protein DBO99_14925 [gamma proteobacterium symbiont of Ctena orbiculata]
MTDSAGTTTDYKISIDSNAHYIFVDVLRPMTSELGRRCAEDAVRLGERNGIKCFLVDLRGSPNIQSTLPNYQFAYHDMKELGFPKDSRSALLIDPDDRSHDFMETVFNNAGYNIRIFTDPERALAWLSS